MSQQQFIQPNNPTIFFNTLDEVIYKQLLATVGLQPDYSHSSSLFYSYKSINDQQRKTVTAVKTWE